MIIIEFIVKVEVKSAIINIKSDFLNYYNEFN